MDCIPSVSLASAITLLAPDNRKFRSCALLTSVKDLKVGSVGGVPSLSDVILTRDGSLITSGPERNQEMFFIVSMQTKEGHVLLFCLSVCLSVSLSVFVRLSFFPPSLRLFLSVSVFLSASLSLCLSACLSLFLYLSVCLSLSQFLSFFLSGCLPLSVSVSVCQSLSLCLSVSVCLSVSLSLSLSL